MPDRKTPSTPTRLDKPLLRLETPKRAAKPRPANLGERQSADHLSSGKPSSGANHFRANQLQITTGQPRARLVKKQPTPHHGQKPLANRQSQQANAQSQRQKKPFQYR